MVATEPFLPTSARSTTMYYARQQRPRLHRVFTSKTAAPVLIGVRKLGSRKFKGLEPMPVYEVVDGEDWDRKALKEIPASRCSRTWNGSSPRRWRPRRKSSSPLDDTGTGAQEGPDR